MGAIIAAIMLCVSAINSTDYQWPVVCITNTTDYQWSKVDTVKAVYYEPEHTTVLGLDGKARTWSPPYVVTEIGRVE